MPNMVLINKVTVGAGGSASIDFTGIPQTYTDLVISTSLRTTGTGGYTAITFNSNTSNYTNRWLQGNGAGASSGNNTGRFAEVPNYSTDTASTFSNSQIYIPNYISSNYKSYSSDTVNENNSTTAYMYLIAGLWSDTSAITSIQLSPSSGNFVQYSTAYLYGVTSSTTSAKATGGTITSDGAYFYHAFLSSGTFTPTAPITADVLVLAGGGAGSVWPSGGRNAAGGGAGGLRLLSNQTLTTTGYTVTVGGGGAGGSSGANGTDSSFNATTATGGGRGGNNVQSAGDGGSGGGGNGGNPGDNAGGLGTAGQGNNGGSGKGSATASERAGGGGGGAGVAGNSATINAGGNGGNGSLDYSSWGYITNTGQNVSGTYYYAGGGGGGGTNSLGIAGLGGGSAAANNANSANGTANTGGGSGASSDASGNGGSGLVIVRYAV
jgi:hypothetical protein